MKLHLMGRIRDHRPLSLHWFTLNVLSIFASKEMFSYIKPNNKMYSITVWFSIIMCITFFHSKYRPRPVVTPLSVGPQAPKGFSGLLWIHLLSGRGLKPTTSHSDHFRDLYCVIECDRVHKARTVIRTGEHSFDWDEVFEIDLVENREIAFLLYTWDPR